MDPWYFVPHSIFQRYPIWYPMVLSYAFQGFSKCWKSFLPHTSHPVGGPYVPNLHNFLRPTPLAVGSGGPASYGHVGISSQPPASSLVPPQQTNIGNQYLSGAHYNNPLYVPYLGGVSN